MGALATCGIGAGLIGAAIRVEAAKMSRITAKARRTDSFTGGLLSCAKLRMISVDSSLILVKGGK
jgi:hypothetical protein